MNKASELRDHFCIRRLCGGRGSGGRRVAGKAMQLRAGTRAGSVCQTAGNLAEGGCGVDDFVGLEVTGGRGRGVAGLFGLWGCFVSAESNRI